MMDEYERLARKYTTHAGGLLDFYRHEMALPLFKPKELEGAFWTLRCLTNPKNRADLDALVKQSKSREIDV